MSGFFQPVKLNNCLNENSIKIKIFKLLHYNSVLRKIH